MVSSTQQAKLTHRSSSQPQSVPAAESVSSFAPIKARTNPPALLARNFRPLPRSRIDGLLAAFPKLIPANSQHTTVETADVRFVYQPFEELYVLLITNKGSNILQVSLPQQTSCRADV
jgi:hypothetical protein